MLNYPNINLLFFLLQNQYRVLLGFGQGKFADGGLILGLSQFKELPQLPLEMTFNLNKAKIDSKTIILLHKSKSLTHSVSSNSDLCICSESL